MWNDTLMYSILLCAPSEVEQPKKASTYFMRLILILSLEKHLWKVFLTSVLIFVRENKNKKRKVKNWCSRHSMFV